MNKNSKLKGLYGDRYTKMTCPAPAGHTIIITNISNKILKYYSSLRVFLSLSSYRSSDIRPTRFKRDECDHLIEMDDGDWLTMSALTSHVTIVMMRVTEEHVSSFLQQEPRRLGSMYLDASVSYGITWALGVFLSVVSTRNNRTAR